jgi:hypothetical protein
MAGWLQTVAKIETSNEEFYRLFRQALEDMAALRLPIKGTDHIVFLPAAGVPWFVAPFGRDSLIVSLHAGDAVMNPDGSPVKGPKSAVRTARLRLRSVWRRSLTCSVRGVGRGSCVQKRPLFSNASTRGLLG